ncbi:MAG: hypothetical protein ACR2J8_15440 [Thermomicrobiales bacterium]
MDEFDQIETGQPDNSDDGNPEDIPFHQRALEPVRDALTAAGFYAYGTLDDRGRWTIAADDEAGHVDVRIGSDGYAIEVWGTSPGLYADEEVDFRRRALERLVRMTLPAVNRGMLAPHQVALWDETEAGVQVRLTSELPFNRLGDIGAFARERLVELEETLAFVESQVTA